MSITVGDDQAGTTLPGTLHPVKTVPLGAVEIQVVLLERQATRIDNVSASLIYYGWAMPGTLDSTAGWQIVKRTIIGNITAEYLADGDSNYDNSWDNRASLTYI